MTYIDVKENKQEKKIKTFEFKFIIPTQSFSFCLFLTR